MNLSIPSSTESALMGTECGLSNILQGNIDHTNTITYITVSFLIVLAIATCPFTIFLNILVIAVVKTKSHLKTNSNIVLACLAVTDASVGVVAQPLYIAIRILGLLGDTSDEYCRLLHSSRNVFRLLAGSSVLHLFLMSFERYLAINHPFKYPRMLNKARILKASVLAWLIAVMATIPFTITSVRFYLTINNALLGVFAALIIFCQVVVYKETRRHERHIATNQISAEAREKFRKEKKALKLTTCVIFFLVLSYLPIFIVRLLLLTSTITSVNLANISLNFVTCIAILNSLINPIIYCVRLRQFRVAFIQMLLRKNNLQAEQFERQIFKSSNKQEPGHKFENEGKHHEVRHTQSR